MDINKPCPLASQIAARIRDARAELTERWIERIAARVRIPADRIFPSAELLDHVPILMDGIADYLEDPSDEITADVPVIAKAMELGELRFGQGFDASEILKEYEILGGVLYSFAARVVADSEAACSHEDLLICSHRIFRAISVIEQVTTAHYLRVLGERVAEREERLRRFSRMITHELKNRVGATLGAGQLLREEWLGVEERQRFAGMVEENALAIQKVLENLTALSKIDGERRRQRNIALKEVVTEVFRQLRELARARAVEMRVAGELPDIQVNAAAVELCLSNYLSNAIKYSDASAAQRWAEVSAVLEVSSDAPGTEQVTVRVRDNGIGVPVESRDQLFERFFRAHTDVVSTEGTGLGLSLVQETAASLGGRAWAEFAEDGGSVFAFSLPSGRDEDTARGGVSDSAGAVTKDGDRPTDATPAKVSD
ncbi:MAG TPA: sensor histidine kinase [Longimicrobiales bacterium]|nr:sensor histidine kinase [Longimicrobiales bacterium]